MVLYLVHFTPFNKKLINSIEIFNEITILTIAYHLILFTDYLTEVELQY